MTYAQLTMAVRALPRSRTQASTRSVSVPLLLLALTLIAPAVDLFSGLQPNEIWPVLGVLGTAVASAALLVWWSRFPRTPWLFAAFLAGGASLAMRLVGADVAPLLSLLTIVALGVGGAFASTDVTPEVVSP